MAFGCGVWLLRLAFGVWYLAFGRWPMPFAFASASTFAFAFALCLCLCPLLFSLWLYVFGFFFSVFFVLLLSSFFFFPHSSFFCLHLSASFVLPSLFVFPFFPSFVLFIHSFFFFLLSLPSPHPFPNRNTKHNPHHNPYTLTLSTPDFFNPQVQVTRDKVLHNGDFKNPVLREGNNVEKVGKVKVQVRLG